MDVTDFVAAVILKATGKTINFASGTTKWLKILGIANLEIQNWYNEPDVDWYSLYDPAFVIGTISNTDTYTIDTDTVRKLSAQDGDNVRILYTDGVGYADYEIVSPDRLKDYSAGVTKQSNFGNYAARIGDQLVFNHTFVTGDPMFGGSITAPVYLFPDPLVGDSDTIPVDNPNWLVLKTAAEYVRTDITRQNMYPDILTEANDAMVRMKSDNGDTQIEPVTMEWSPLGLTW